jgi:hypothetical protein
VKSKQLPPLPAKKSLPAGPVPVTRTPGLLEKEDSYGKCNWFARTIEVDADMERTASHLTLEHERVHMIFLDAGIEFTDRVLEERICDAIALARVYEMANR